tara:strand:+ start:4089 stop:4484 length:396 start_codon:yes stop_codon:yes gene_type:complete
MTDPIADYLTRLRNALSAKHKVVEVPASNIKKRITEILFDQGFINGYKYVDGFANQGAIKIALKYRRDNAPVISKIERISTPGKREYFKSTDSPRIINGLGVAIVSTSRGVMTDKEARVQNVGGEVLCKVY